MSKLIYLPVADLYPHPDNPRKDLGDLAELSGSIKANGIYQNLTVVRGHNMTDEEWRDLAQKYQETPDEDIRTAMNSKHSEDGYTVIIGHRRLAAAKQADLKEVPCVVAKMSEEEQIQTMLLENMQRSDLTIYEQAKGFQILLNFGSTVDEISQRSGFSPTTIRRRVKIMELDQERLKTSVDARQIPLSAFDELSKIEDIEERNKLLDFIGTAQWNYQLNSALRRQTAKQLLPEAQKTIKNIQAEPIKPQERWNGKFTKVLSIDFCNWEEDKSKIPLISKEPLFYYLDQAYGTLDLYEKVKTQKQTKKRSKEEIEKEKQIAKGWEYIKKQSDILYDLRKEFIEKVHYTSKNELVLLRGLLIAEALRIDFLPPNRDGMANLLDIQNASYYQRGTRVLENLEKLDNEKLPLFVWYSFDDNPDRLVTACGLREGSLVYRPQAPLIGLYKWLEMLGYEMSEIEKGLVYGTDPIYQAKED